MTLLYFSESCYQLLRAPPPAHSTNLVSYSEIQGTGGEDEPACSAFGEAAALAFIQDNKTAISEEKGNGSRLLGFPGAGLRGRPGVESPRPEPRARPRATQPGPAAPAAHATPPPGPAPAPYLVIRGASGRRGRRERTKGKRSRRRLRRGAALAAATSAGNPRGRRILPSEQWDSGARGAWAALLLGTLQVLALLGAARESALMAGKWPRGSPAPFVGRSALPRLGFPSWTLVQKVPRVSGRTLGADPEVTGQGGGKLRLGPVTRWPRGRLLRKLPGASPLAFWKRRSQAGTGAHNLLSLPQVGFYSLSLKLMFVEVRVYLRLPFVNKIS
ncbi:hypothetical protein H8959_002805 [Pygathrix nigripes]